MSLNDRLLSFLGIAVKSGNVDFGYQRVIDGMKNNSVFLVILAQDLSERTKKNFLYELQNMKEKSFLVEWIQINRNISDINLACGKYSGVLGIKDIGIASKIKELAAEDCSERSI